MREVKILLVDSDDDRFVVAERLRGAGHTVIVRSTAHGTAAAVIRDNPELVLLNVTMPLLTEAEVGSLRSGSQVPETTLVVYAERSVAELTALVDASKADGFVEKTHDIDELMRRIRVWLPRRRRNKVRSGTELRARYVVVAADGATHRAVLELVGRDTVARHTDDGMEALRWMSSAHRPDLVVAGTSLTDLSALAHGALELDPRWRDRLLVVDEGVGVGREVSHQLAQLTWRRSIPIEELATILRTLFQTGCSSGRLG